MALSDFRQGDVLVDLTALHVTDERGWSVAVPAELGVVIISQTCDVVLPDRPGVQVAVRVQLPESAAREARDGKRPRYAHLSALGEREFADLELVSTVAKPWVSGQRRIPGVDKGADSRRFSLRVARRYGRFPFPDEVVPWLRPLQSVVTSKALRPTSPEGHVLDHVVELRVEAANGWLQPPYDLVLLVIVKPGTLPTFEGDSLPDRPDEVSTWLYGDSTSLQVSSAEIAERLIKSVNAVERYWYWVALTEAWAARCSPPSDAAADVTGAVSSLLGEVVPSDEFPLTRYRKSEELDLDHLSAPTPD